MNLRDNHKAEILGAIESMKSKKVPLDKINGAVKVYVDSKKNEYQAEEKAKADELAKINEEKEARRIQKEKNENIEKERVANLTTKSNWDDNNPVTWANKDEDEFIGKFKSKYKDLDLTVQTTNTLGDKINISGEGFNETIKLDGSEESIAALERAKQWANEKQEVFDKDGPGYNLLSGVDTIGFGGKKTFDFEDITRANRGYKSMGIKIVKPYYSNIRNKETGAVTTGYEIQTGSYNDEGEWVPTPGVEFEKRNVDDINEYLNNRDNFTIEQKEALATEGLKTKKQQNERRKTIQTDIGRTVSVDDSKKSYAKSKQAGLDTKILLKGMNDEDMQKVSNFLSNPIIRNDSSRKPEENWEATRLDNMFSDEVRNTLSPEGQVIFDAAKESDSDIRSRSIKKENDIVNEKIWNAEYAERFRKGDEKLLVKYGAKVESKNLKEEFKSIENNVKESENTYKADIDNISRFAKDIFSDARKNGVTVEVVKDANGDNIYKAVGDNSADYQKRFNLIRSREINARDKFKTTQTVESNRYKNWATTNQNNEEIFKFANKDGDLGRIMGDQFLDACSSIGGSLPILFGSEQAILNHASRQEGSIAYEDQLDYKTAKATNQGWRYSAVTGATQGPNILLAVGTAGVGSAFGATSLVASAMTSTAFGINSGTSKYADLTIQKVAGEEATERLKQLEENKDFMDYEDYINQKAALVEQESLGDMTPNQILGQSLVTGIIEGGVAFTLGTIPNASKLVKGVISGPGDDILNAVTQKTLKYYAGAGLEFGKRTMGEILEESIIHFGDVASESLILGRDADFAGWEDVVASSIIVGGTMNGPGIAYSSIMNRVQTKPDRIRFNESKALIQDYKNKIARLPNTPDGEIQKEQLRIGIQEEYSKSVVLQNDMEVTGMLLGGDGTRDLLRNGIVIDNLYNEAGVIPGDAQTVIDDKVEKHKETLKADEKKDYEGRLKLAVDQKQKIMGKVDFENGHRVWGERGDVVHNDLLKNDPAYKKMTDKQRASKVHQTIKADIDLDMINEAKADPSIKAMVEQQIGSPAILRDKRKAKDRKELEDQMYLRYGKMFGGFKSEAVSKNIDQEVNARDLIGDKRLSNLSVVQVSDKGFENDIRQMERDGQLGKGESAQDIIDGIKEGETFGAIVGNKYIVTDATAAAKNLADGRLYQGTVFSHEVKHAADALAFSDSEMASYSENLALWTSENAKPVHDEAMSRIMSQPEYTGYDATKAWVDQDNVVHREYGNYVQDAIQRKSSAEFRKKLNTNKAGFMSAFNSDYDISSPQNAAAYLADHMNSFDKGKMGRLTKKRIDSAKKRGDKIENAEGQNVRRSSDLQGILDREFEGSKTPKSDMARFVDTMLKTDFNGKPMVEGEQQLSAFNFQVGGIVEATTKRLYDPIPRDNKRILSRADYVSTLLSDAGVLIATEYDPTLQNLDDFLSNRLNLRANSLAKKLGVTQAFTTDIDNASNIYIDEETNFDENENPIEPGTPFTDNLQLTPAEIKTVLDHVQLNLGAILPSVEAKRGPNAVVSPLVSKLKKEFYKEKNPIQQTIEAAMGKTPAEVEMWLKDPKNKANILKNMPTTWLAKNMPKAVQKLVVQEDGTKIWTTDHVGRKKGTKPGQVDFYRSTEKGPYFGMTDGKQKIRRNPKAMTEITSVDLIKKFFNGTSMTDLRRGGLNTLTQAMSQEIGLEQFKSEMIADGEIAKMFRSRQELLHGEVNDNVISTVVDQIERGNVLKSSEGKPVTFGTIIANYDPAVMAAQISNRGAIEGFDSTEYQDQKALYPELVPLLEHLEQTVYKDGFSKETDGYIKQITDKVPSELNNFIKDKGYYLKDKDGNYTDHAENVANDLKELAKNGWIIKTDPGKLMKTGIDAKLIKKIRADVFGFVDKALNPAKVSGKFPNPDGTKGKAPFYDTKQEVLASLKDQGLDVDGVMVMNVTNAKFRNLITPLMHGDMTLQQRLDYMASPDFINTVSAANISNINAFGNLINGFAKLPLKSMFTVLQAQTNIVNGFRGLSMFDYVMPGKFIDNRVFKQLVAKPTNDQYKEFVKELKTHDLYDFAYDFYKKRYADSNPELTGDELDVAINRRVYTGLSIKGEHIKPNGNTMADLLIATAGKKPGTLTKAKLDNAVKDHTQMFAPKIITDDLLDKELGTNSNESHARITIALKGINDVNDKPIIDRIFHVTGVKAAKAVSLNELGQDLFKSDGDMDKAKILEKAYAQKYLNKDAKGITVLDFDDTLATSKSLIRYTKPDGSKGTLTPEQYASTYESLSDLGYKFDFSEFNEVIDGKIAPLFNKAMKLQGKFGPENMFVLTARPAEAATAIHAFLNAKGLKIPIQNITGLANSTAEAKALWIADKVGEGYNDFYFADDALQNVQAVDNMLEQFDVKRKVQQAVLKSSDPGKSLNAMIARSLGVAEFKEFSSAKAQLAGKTKGKYKFFIAPGAEDFKGLMYPLLGKGAQGDADMQFFKDKLFDPFSRGIDQMNSQAVNLSSDFKALNKAMPKSKKMLNKRIGDSLFTYDNAARVYLWEKNGIDIPGLSKADKALMLKAIQASPEMMAYADGVAKITKTNGYIEPESNWLTSTIPRDLYGMTQGQGRKKSLAEFIQNREAMFGAWENGRLNGPLMNKLEASLGTNWRDAMEDMLWRMENGSNRSFGKNKLTNRFANWVNNSVGAIMFLNGRSAVLQTLSTVNYINWSDNNPAKAAMAFANQKQFWKDFSYIFNSDMLKQRRSGNQRSVSESELAQIAASSDNAAGAILQKLLDLGFLPTQIADSFAIASGGASMYRNRVNKYMKEGMSKADAEKKAWTDFQKITEESQQSSRPDMISSQQASPLGRLILAFQNTPMQYARLTKKAILDLKNGRGDTKTNISKIVYYAAVQNLIFSALQTAMFKFMFDDEEEDRSEEKAKKTERLVNGMLDSFLRGTGVAGAIVATLKNMVLRFIQENEKGFNFSESAIMVEMLNVSPPIGSKLRKVRTGLQTYKYKKKEIEHMDLNDINNPVWSTVTQGVSALTNIPVDRAYNKIMNLQGAFNEDNETWQRIGLSLGWNQWDLDVKNEAVEQAGVEIQEIKEAKKEAKKQAKRKEKEKLKKEQEAREVQCSAKTRKGKGPRCKNRTENKSGKCYAHQ